MMDHEHFQRALLADPRSRDTELLAHRAECTECSAFATRVLAFEARLERAIRDDAKWSAEVLPFKRRAAHPTRRAGWLALAVSVILALAVAGGFWLAVPRSSLAADVIAHMAGEPDAWKTRTSVPTHVLNSVLENANMSLDSNAPSVSYASACTFRGRVVPHLVVQSPQGPVTVMVLTHESVSKPKKFDEHAYRGTIVPVPNHGSIAVLMRVPDSTPAEVDAVARQVREAIVWGPQTR